MPVHLQDEREDLYAQPACGASNYTGPTTTTGMVIDCPTCLRIAGLEEE